MEEGSITPKGTSSNAKNPPQISKPVRKRSTKKVRGQKDIRTLIRSKKNELVSYTKDFNLICKESGIDVDSEQLQLAIALSKSLQDSVYDKGNGNTAKPLTANQRKGKIRTTLLEYGFKVPEIKKDIRKKIKKKKQYKLLLSTDLEKQQLISERYAQVLLENANVSRLNNRPTFHYSDAQLFKLSSNVPYEFVKNNDVFYIEGLVKKSLNCRNHMLKDWSEIPGRPASPKLEVPDISFSSIECSQEELDEILSGTLNISQAIIGEKYIKVSTCTKINTNDLKNLEVTSPTLNFEINIQQAINFDVIQVTEMDSTRKIDEDVLKNSPIKEICNDMNCDKILPPYTYRSCSPDLFDDEVTIIMDDVRDKREEDSTQKTMVREQYDFMDLTECVNGMSYNNVNKQTSCLSQGTNNTRMNLNDFMDLTGCVAASSQKNLHSTQDNLKGHSNQDGKENCNPITNEGNEKIDILDLTQSSNCNSNFPSIQNTQCVNKSLDDTIILNDEDYSNINSGRNLKSAAKISELIDLVDEECYVMASSSTTTKKSKANLDNGSIHSTEENEIQSCNFSLDNNLQSDNLQKGVPVVSSEHLNQNEKKTRDNLQKESNAYEVMDLTQSSDSGDNTPHVQINYEAGNEDGAVDSLHDEYCNIKQTKDRYNSLCDISEDHPLPTPKATPITSTFYNDDIGKSHYLENDNIHDYDIACPIIKKPDQDIQNKHNATPECNKNLENIDNVNLDIDCHTNILDLPPHNIHDIIELDDEEQNSPKNTNKCNDKSYCESSKINITPNANNTNKLYDFCNLEIENDREFDSMLENVSKSKQEDQSDHLWRSRSIYFEVSEIGNKANGFSNNKSNCLDISQHSDSSEKFIRPEINVIPEELGKRNNISIDYDEVLIETGQSSHSSTKHNTSLTDVVKLQKCKNPSKDDARLSLSQNSEVFEISDDEFNYSVHQHKEKKFNLGGLSVIDDFLNCESLTRISKSFDNPSSNAKVNCNDDQITDDLPRVNLSSNVRFSTDYIRPSAYCNEIKSVVVSTPLKTISKETVLLAQTPGCGDYIINTDRVSPKPDYERMTTPERNIELDKYGIKPLKRKRAIQMLTHIYDQTHPFMEIIPSNKYESPSKKRKISDIPSPRKKLISIIDKSTKLEKGGSKLSPQKKIKSPVKSQKSVQVEQYSNKSDKENDLYIETKHVPDIRDIQCCSEDWFFQKREKAKLHSCRVPLHVAFHNYVSCRRLLKDAILRYEPINIDAIHRGLVANGYRYNPKDLLKFMDKKCITVKTADNLKNARK